jgi:hypothetical protein
MIITDIATINRMAEEVSSIPGFVNVDAYDFALLKEYSDYIQAIRMEVTSLEESTFDTLATLMRELKTENICSFIFYVMLNGESVDIPKEQFLWIHTFIENNLPDVDATYGVGRKEGDGEGFTIMLFAGFKDENL